MRSPLIVALAVTGTKPTCPCGDPARDIAVALTEMGELVTWSLCPMCARNQIVAAAATMVRIGEGTYVEPVTAEHWKQLERAPLQA